MSKEPVGSVAEEAAKLFAILQQAAHTTDAHAGHGEEPNEAAGQHPDSSADEEPGASTHKHAAAGGVDGEGCEHEVAGPAECTWCPVCQLISRVRSTSPETVEHLATAAAAVLGSVRSLLEAAAEAARQAKVDAEARVAEQARSAEQSRSAAHEPEPPARSRVDRIDVSEDPEPWD